MFAVICLLPRYIFPTWTLAAEICCGCCTANSMFLFSLIPTTLITLLIETLRKIFHFLVVEWVI